MRDIVQKNNKKKRNISIEVFKDFGEGVYWFKEFDIGAVALESEEKYYKIKNNFKFHQTTLNKIWNITEKIVIFVCLICIIT